MGRPRIRNRRDRFKWFVLGIVGLIVCLFR